MISPCFSNFLSDSGRVEIELCSNHSDLSDFSLVIDSGRVEMELPLIFR